MFLGATVTNTLSLFLSSLEVLEVFSVLEAGCP